MTKPQKQALHFVHDEELHRNLHMVNNDETKPETRPSSGYGVAVCAALVECLGMVGGVAWAISAPDRNGLFTRIAIVVALAVSGAAVLALGMALALRSRRSL